jgi:predicted PurR-regulated permease PerM
MDRAPASLLILLGVLLLLLWLAPEVPLLGFAGVLLAVALRLPAAWLARHVGMRRWVAVLALVGGLVLGIGLAGWFAWAPLADQATQLSVDLPRGIMALQERMSESRMGGWLAERIASEMPRAAENAMSSAISVASGTLGILGNTLLVVLIGVYLAIRPRDYLGGLRALLAPSFDMAARATLAECREVLRGFLLGQGFAMVLTGTLTWIGLTLLGVPLAGVLAVITAVLGFIPILGPVIAAVPAVLLAVVQSPALAVWVVVLFLVIQNIEGNFITPMVQSRAADLPPVLLLLVQILMGAMFGLLGVMLAAPAAAVGLVIVRRAYVEGWLGREERTITPPGG